MDKPLITPAEIDNAVAYAAAVVEENRRNMAAIDAVNDASGSTTVIKTERYIPLHRRNPKTLFDILSANPALAAAYKAGKLFLH